MQAWAAQGVPAAVPAPGAAVGLLAGMPLVLPGMVPTAWPLGDTALPPGQPKQ